MTYSNKEKLDAEQVSLVLRRSMSQLLRTHGGGVDLYDIQGHCVRIRFTGTCRSCMSASDELRNEIQETLRRELSDTLIEVRVHTGVSDALIAEAKRILSKHA